MAEARSRGRRTIFIVLASVLLVVVAAVAWVVVRGLQAKAELESATLLAETVSSSLQDGDLASAREELEELGGHAATAASLTGDIVWRAAEFIPFAGPNLTAVRVSSSGVDTLVSGVASPLFELVDEVAPGDDRILDLGVLSDAKPMLAEAVSAVSSVQAELALIDTDAVVAPLASGVEKLSEVVASVAPAVAAASDAAEVLPAFLGADSARTVLVMVQNNAELRTGGGITGTFLELRADDGRIAIVSQSDSRDFDKLTTPIIPVAESTTALYGDGLGQRVQNASMSADFDQTSRLASAWWKSYSGEEPDAVVSIDPLVLKAIVEASGPITTTAGLLDTKDFVESLLVTPYMTLDQAGQTDLFEQVSTTAFEAVSGGEIDVLALASALADSIEEGRISVWSAHPDEQKILSGSPLAGPAARQALAGDDAYAVYFNDSTGGKMDNFLGVSLSVGAAVCRADGRSDVEVVVTLTNEAPDDVLTYPAAMTGGGVFGTAPGDIKTIITVSAPVGSFQGAVRVDEDIVNAKVLEDSGFPVSATTVVLEPGASKDVSFRFTSPTADLVDPVVLHTPLLAAPEMSTLVPTCD